MNAPILSSKGPLAGGRPPAPGMLVNFLLYQLAWFACVAGAAYDLALPGTAVALSIVAWHVARVARPAAELKLILITGLVGGIWETFLVGLDWVRYQGTGTVGMAPLWILALWLAFGTTFNGCLRWLKGRPGLSAGLGLVAGPLAWWGGQQLGALVLVHPLMSLVVIGTGWAVLMPLLMALASRLDAAGPAPRFEAQ